MANERQNLSPKRHCMVVHAYYPLGETRVQREALALVDHGFEVDVICLRGKGEPTVAEEDGVNIYRLPVIRHKGSGVVIQFLEYLAFFVLAFGMLLFLYARKRYSTIQVHNLPDFLVFAALGPRLAGAKVILDLHDLMPELFASKFDSGMNSWPVRLVSWQEQQSTRFADHVITVTDTWKQRLIQHGVPEGKVSVVMNLADPRIFRSASTTPKPEKKGNCFKLIYHGTFTFRYGVDLIIHAVNKVRTKIPNIHLTLIGAGECREELIELTKELDLEDFVEFSADVLRADKLPPFIWQADVGIVANRSNIFTDGLLPTKLMEYVALGTPVIAARTPTIRTYFDDSMIQFFTPGDVDELADCILSLHNDRQRLAQISRKADKFNQLYNWDKQAENYASLVESLNGRLSSGTKRRIVS